MHTHPVISVERVIDCVVRVMILLTYIVGRFHEFQHFA